MELIITLVVNITMIIGAICWILVPTLSRRGIFFGITVEPDFRQSVDARRILSQYRRTIAIIAGVCTAGLWLATPFLSGLYWPLALTLAMLIQFGGSVASAVRANRQVKNFATPPPLIRTASLAPSKRSLPGGWMPLLAPAIGIAAAGLAILMRRDSMPPETGRAAFSLWLVGFVAVTLFLWLAYVTVFCTRQLGGDAAVAREEQAMRRIHYFLLLLLSYFTAACQIVISLNTAKIVTAGGWLILVFVFSWLVLASLGVTALFRAAKRRTLAMEASGTLSGDSFSDVCWIWGIVYYNPDDPALVVPKRIGFGWDLNFGNKWSWVFALALITLPFAIRLFWF